MIEERMVDVAVCDACGHRDYSDYDGSFFGSNGYTLTIVHHGTETNHQAVACKDTHIGKAARAVLDAWRNEPQGGWEEKRDAAPLSPDAPPLPEVVNS